MLIHKTSSQKRGWLIQDVSGEYSRYVVKMEGTAKPACRQSAAELQKIRFPDDPPDTQFGQSRLIEAARIGFRTPKS